MNNLPLVSVIIGTYNRERYIRECLRSVLAQTYQNIEVIVVDDASVDGTLDVLNDFKDDIVLVRRERNSGTPAVPRNQALQYAKGDYIAYLDSDDLWKPEKIEMQVSEMENEASIDISHTYATLIDGCGCVKDVRHDGQLINEETLSHLLNHCYITLSSTVFRRSVIMELNGYDENPVFRISNDYELYLRAIHNYRIVLIDKALTYYRSSDESISKENKYWKSTPEDFSFYGDFLKYSNMNISRALHQMIRIAAYRAASINSIFWRDHGYPLRSLYFCWKGLGLAPFSDGLLLECVKSVGSWMFRREEMRRRRSGDKER